MEHREVAVVIPHIKNKILMQLRDQKDWIDYPGNWGLFGGRVEKSDVSPAVAAQRELHEEIGYRPERLHSIGVNRYGADIPMVSHRNMIQHCFYCKLEIPLAGIVLTEGMDFGLFSLDQILTGELFSARLQQSFPVVPNQIMIDVIERCIHEIESAVQNRKTDRSDHRAKR